MAHDVFISHSSRDKDLAEQVCGSLERAGIHVWMAPRDILPGQAWGASIIQAIGNSRAMVLLLSSASNDSPQVMREVERAVAKRVPIIPVRTEDVLPTESMEYFLGATHWLDAFGPGLDAQLQRVVDTVQITLSGFTRTPGKSRREQALHDESVTRSSYRETAIRRYWPVASALTILVASAWIFFESRQPDTVTAKPRPIPSSSGTKAVSPPATSAAYIRGKRPPPTAATTDVASMRAGVTTAGSVNHQPGKPRAIWNMQAAMARGKQVYARYCADCHMLDGSGNKALGAKPIAGSPIATGPLPVHLKRVLDGYGVMPAWGNQLSNTDLAAVITYEGNAFGNHAGVLVKPEDVANSQAATGNASSAAVPSLTHVVVNFTVASWLEVYDANGKRLYYDLAAGGSSVALDGPGPMEIFLGHARGVSMTLNGTPYDFSAAIQVDGAARFKLGKPQG